LARVLRTTQGFIQLPVGADGQIVLDLGNAPAFPASGRYGFRIACIDGRHFLARVDPSTGGQALLHAVDGGMTLVGLSSDGEVACLVREVTMGRSTAVVLHVPML